MAPKVHRTSRDMELVRWGESTFYTASRFIRKNGDLLVEVAFSPERGKRIRLNGVHQDTAIDYIGAANVVIFGPDDLRIIKGGPVERRKFLDSEISAVNERYRKDLADYRRILIQRNTYLKDARHKVDSIHVKAALDVWDEQLVSVGVRIMVRRAKVIQEFSALAQNAWRDISSLGLLKLIYRPSFDVESPCLSDEQADEQGMTKKWSALFHDELVKLRQDELMRGVTLVGPHRDDMVFTLDGTDMRAFSSQGQQRAAVLALRLAELDFIRSEMGEDAILLLDDVSSELDPEKRAHLWKYIDRGIQTVITTTDEKIVDELSEPGKIFLVQAGSVQEAN